MKIYSVRDLLVVSTFIACWFRLSASETLQNGVHSHSVFLRASSSHEDQNDRNNRVFVVEKGVQGNPSREESAEFLEIADPTFDGPFKWIFGPCDNEAGGNKVSVMSLLNSLLFPGMDSSNENSKMIRDLEYLSNELPTNLEIEREEPRKTFKVLRCDLVCKCSIGTKKDMETQGEKSQVCAVIFDVEMQRKDVKRRIEGFCKYIDLLKKTYPGEKVTLISLLNYKTSDISDNLLTGVDIRISGEGRKKGEVTCEIVRSDYQGEFPGCVISIPLAIKEILKNPESEIRIMKIGDDKDHKILQTAGKEWLKFLGVSHWASKSQNGWYFVPSDAKTCDVKNVMKSISRGNLSEKHTSAYSLEVTKEEQLDNDVEDFEQYHQAKGEVKQIVKRVIISMAKDNTVPPVEGRKLNKELAKGQESILNEHFLDEISKSIEVEDFEERGEFQKCKQKLEEWGNKLFGILREKCLEITPIQ